LKKKILSVVFLVFAVGVTTTIAQSTQGTNFDWIKNARTFIIDGYDYPLSPKIEFDAVKLAETMVDMDANVVRIATSGNHGWLIPATEFKVNPDLENRDILAETITACKPRGIKVVAYVSTGNTINAPLINPEWAQQVFGSLYDMYLKARPGQEVIKRPLAGELIPTHLYETVDVLGAGAVAADMVEGTGNVPVVPGLVVARYGKGKVAYIAAGVGAMYEQTGIREFADFIRDVIEYVSPEGVPYEIVAPIASLITNMTVKGDKLVLHLINRTGSNHERKWQNNYSTH
jgi:hypothetical protein